MDLTVLLSTNSFPTCEETTNLINCTRDDCNFESWNGLECLVEPLQMQACNVTLENVPIKFVAKVDPDAVVEEEDDDMVLPGSGGSGRGR